MKRTNILIVAAIVVKIFVVSGCSGVGARVAAPSAEPAGGQIDEIGEVPFYTEWPFDVEEAKRRQIETAEAQEIPVEKTIDMGEGITLEMILIPAGEFIMGSPEDEDGRLEFEGPQRRVRITQPFYMGKYEVTQAQWERMMEENPSHFKGADLPVTFISWIEAREFLGKVDDDIRLPTEAEWEYACRAGSATRFYSGDSEDDLDDAGWYGENSSSRTHPVGEKRPNAWGLFDMHGNVLEWCADWFQDSYIGLETTDPKGPETGTYRVIRGGSWFNTLLWARSASRSGLDPEMGGFHLGFRFVSPAL